MLRNSISGYIKQTINKIASSAPPYNFTYANLKTFAELLSSLAKLDKNIIELDNDYDNYEDAYQGIEISKENKISNHLLFLALVSFHQKKGSVVEFTIPKREDLQNNPILKSLANLKFFSAKEILDDLFTQLPNYALTDGIHLVNKDTEFFFIHNYQKPLYCLSHYVQIKTDVQEENDENTKNVVDDFQKNERNCIQKALCIISTIPLFGNSIIYQNFFTQLINQMDTFMSQDSLNDKTNLDILYNSLFKINDTKNNKWMFNLRKIYCYLKEDIFILIKLLLLEKRIIVYSQIPSNASLFIMSLISLLPGEISQGLLEAYDQNGMPLKIFHDKFLIYPLFSLFDLDMLLSKIKTNKNINFLIGTTNTMVLNSNKFVCACQIDLDKPEIKFNKKDISSNITTINDIEEKNNTLISNFIGKNIKDEGAMYIANKKYSVDGDWIVSSENEIYSQESKFIKKIINNYFFSILADISFINKEIKNKNNYIKIDRNTFPIYDTIKDNYNKYMNNTKTEISKRMPMIPMMPKMQMPKLPLQKAPTMPKSEKNLTVYKPIYPSIEEIISEPLYNIVNTILSYNITNSKIIPCSNKYKNLESLISKPNNLEFIINWIETKNFKKWYCSYKDILTNLSIFNLEKIYIKKIYDFDNNLYSGDLLNGKKTGSAKLKYVDEDLLYVGDFKNGLREGKGNLASSDNKFMYDGGWKNDKYHGEGSLLSPKLGKYSGFFKDGLFDGKGYLITPENNSYNGKFLKGEKSGEGEYKLNNGYVYKGGFKNDLYHGNGKLYDNKNKIIQEGKFQKGEFVKFVK